MLQTTEIPLTKFRSLHQDLVNFHLQRAEYLKDIDPYTAMEHLDAAKAHNGVLQLEKPTEQIMTDAFEKSLAAFNADDKAIEKANENITRIELVQTDLSLDSANTQTANGKANLIALSLTEEQARLLIYAEYPNNFQAQATALFDLAVQGKPINIMNESVALNYSHDLKKFYATLFREEQYALEGKLTELTAEQRRAYQVNMPGRQAGRQSQIERKEIERDKDFERD